MAVKNDSFGDMVQYLANGGTTETHPFSHTTNITVNLDALEDNTAQYNAAIMALNIWKMTTGITFTLSSAEDAEIIVDNEELGSAYAQSTYNQNGKAISAFVNIGKDWMDEFPLEEQWGYGSYGLQTFIHEFGHVLGLEHPGDYNGSGSYATDAIFSKDSYQYTVMSYFTQSDSNDATDRYLYTPMMADYAAMKILYGPIAVNAGNTTYGKGETVWGGLTDFDKTDNIIFTVNDTGGMDTFDFSNTISNQLIDLHGGAFSNVNGDIKNVGIAYGTVIEVAKGGTGNDIIRANDSGSSLYGNIGNDSLTGGSGADKLYSGVGNDILRGGAGKDTFFFRAITEAKGDKIMDFAQGQDRMNFHDTDANSRVLGNQDFTWLGSGAFSGTAGQLHLVYNGLQTLVTGDINGDKIADFSVTLNGHYNLTAGDMIL